MRILVFKRKNMLDFLNFIDGKIYLKNRFKRRFTVEDRVFLSPSKLNEISTFCRIFRGRHYIREG